MAYNGEPVTDGITSGVEVRKQRGLEIAARCKVVRRKDGQWSVPSQSGKASYRVCAGHHRCTCPDFELRKCKCKHQWAVEFVQSREQNDDGTETVTQSLTVTEQITRPSYPQNWPAYNAAQVNEKDKFQLLLRELCAAIEEPPQSMGRPRLPLSDMAFALAFKVYSTVSGRRFSCDLRSAYEKGYLSRLPHYNTLFDYFETPALTPILKNLIEQSSLPLRAVETDFAVDSTGFCGTRFTKWFNEKYGQNHVAKSWVKTHLICGVKTNIVTSVEIGGKFDHDSPFLPGLVNATAKNFKMAEVSADKGYHGRPAYNAIAAVGAHPYIPFKSDSKLDLDTSNRRTVIDHTTLWSKMYHLYHFKKEEFLPRYHKRSNVESTFMAIKSKFGDAVRSRTDVAQINEVLCKVLCHNVCVVIQSMYELGIQPAFGLN
jgi:transposase